MFERIVVALKEGLPTSPLLDIARGVAAPGATLHLVTLVLVGKEEDEAARLASARDGLDTIATTLRDEGWSVECHAGLVLAGAAHDILRIADDVDADLLVIGLGKRTRVGKALMGSDAQRILIESPRPVLSLQLG